MARKARSATDPDVLASRIERVILLIRGHKVILARDLANLYAVPTKVLNQTVKRNLRRFPEDFMFQLTWEEARSLSLKQARMMSRFAPREATV
jgi:hypothetical protein